MNTPLKRNWPHYGVPIMQNFSSLLVYFKLVFFVPYCFELKLICILTGPNGYSGEEMAVYADKRRYSALVIIKGSSLKQ